MAANLDAPAANAAASCRQPWWLRIRNPGVGLTAALLGIGLSSHAHAQLLNVYFPPGLPGTDVTQGVTVQSRARPDYDFEGTRVGDVVIRPQVAESFGYNDNLLGRSNGSGSSFAKSEASVQANTDWSRDSLGAFIGTEDRRYFDIANQNETNWRASLGGTLDIGRDVATLTYKHISAHQDPTDIDSSNFDRPAAYQVEDVRASYRIQFPRFSLTPAIELFSYQFSNTTFGNLPVIEKGRNRNVLQEELTGRYEVTPQSNIIALIRPVQVYYTDSVNGARNPNANGVSFLGGLDYAGSGSLRFRALVGYESRHFDYSFKPVSAPIAEGSVSWTPTGLTTYTAAVSRAVEDAGDESGAGYVFTQAKLSVDHEYRRNVLLNGYVGLQNADYLDSNRHETIYQGGAGVTWLLNHYMRLAATADFTSSKSSGLQTSISNPTGVTSQSPSYSRNIYLLRLEFGRFDPSYY